ncbi:MarR family transcriptional regulator [Hyphomicrobium sp.]|uniref:MarR family winged helix-turn-helix transcriptional regulator n=1 Tax=Hyphomicrobium sp. TaxID=82 RepID=UPI0025C48E7C|nr:MarR family transcriptional regulator [Hyphomicrobium sp.]MCC7253145.1 MarR family transcriptional regulator [Hyphomicrobium sp.]
MLEVECYCTLVRRSARALTEFYDIALAPSGLRVTQYSLLRAIERLEKPSLTLLAESTGLDRSTLGRNLRVLEKAGFVVIRPGIDERTRIVELKPQARHALKVARPLWTKAQTKVAAAVPAQARQYLRTLTKAVEN